MSVPEVPFEWISSQLTWQFVHACSRAPFAIALTISHARNMESPLAKCILKKAASPARYGRSERCAEARDAVRPSWLPSRYDIAGRLRSPAASGVPFACVR